MARDTPTWTPPRTGYVVVTASAGARKGQALQPPVSLQYEEPTEDRDGDQDDQGRG